MDHRKGRILTNKEVDADRKSVLEDAARWETADGKYLSERFRRRYREICAREIKASDSTGKKRGMKYWTPGTWDGIFCE